jgi:DNA-binding GntR family transcriptional regulator
MLRGSGNGLIEELLQRLVARINFLRAQSMSRAGRAKFSAKEMRAIYLAIAKGDSRSARKAAQAHVKNAEDAARDILARDAMQTTGARSRKLSA